MKSIPFSGTGTCVWRFSMALNTRGLSEARIWGFHRAVKHGVLGLSSGASTGTYIMSVTTRLSRSTPRPNGIFRRFNRLFPGFRLNIPSNARSG